MRPSPPSGACADAAFEATMETLQTGPGDPARRAAVDTAYEHFAVLQALRQEAAKALAKPGAARGPELARQWFAAGSEMIATLQELMSATRYRAHTTVRRIEALIDLRQAIAVMSGFALRERGLLAGLIAGNQRLSQDDLVRLSVFRGHLEQAWDRVSAYRGEASALPGVAAQIDRVREDYFDTFQSIRAPIIAAGLSARPYPVTLGEWFAQSNAAIEPLLDLDRLAGAQAVRLVEARAAQGLRSLLYDTAILLLIVAIAILSTRIVFTWIVRPLEKITGAMSALAADQEGITVPCTDRHGEIGAMARAVQVFKTRIEAKAGEVRDANAKLQRLNRELEGRVDLRTRELAAARDEAVRSSQAKSQFLANMSHELRTPMNAIIGFTGLVMRRCQELIPARQYNNLEKIRVSADHLLALINDVLDLSKIEAGQMEIRMTQAPVETLVEHCTRALETAVQDKGLTLETHIEPDLPVLHTDQDKLRQILINLLSNAVKFTAEGKVVVSVGRRADAITFAVADSGIGIPPEARELIFEEFRQVDDSSTREYGGTGLGLSISRRLARLMGGDLTVESEPERGSTFTVFLPLRAAEPEHAVPAPPARLPIESNGARLVLAIDDDPNAIDILQENLAEAGYRVVGATDGEEGLRRARELKPLAIFLDIVMPRKDGWQTLRALKADPETREIPVILLSIIDQKDLGYRLGAADYLLKPIDRDAILAALAHQSPLTGRLLIADDDPMVLDVVCQLLEGEGFEIDTACNGREALAAVEQQAPALILLDLLMPEVDGFSVMEQLGRNPRTRDIPIIVLTAKTLSSGEEEELRARARAVLTKQGFQRDELLSEVRGALARYAEAR